MNHQAQLLISSPTMPSHATHRNTTSTSTPHHPYPITVLLGTIHFILNSNMYTQMVFLLKKGWLVYISNYTPMTPLTTYYYYYYTN